MIRLYNFTFSKLHFYLIYGENRDLPALEWPVLPYTSPSTRKHCHSNTFCLTFLSQWKSPSRFKFSSAFPQGYFSGDHPAYPALWWLLSKDSLFSGRNYSCHRSSLPDIFSTSCFPLVAEPSLSFEVWLLGEAVCSDGLSPSGWRRSDSGF